jgi:hypothetical protein|tara:strand:+ start:288 stop:509 length:222 start_codon:yes stop_codon:yes gene_type:complete
MKIKSRITVRPKQDVLNNAIKQGLISKIKVNNYKYLYSKYYKLENKWYDVFMNLDSSEYESVEVEIWTTEEKE